MFRYPIAAMDEELPEAQQLRNISGVTGYAPNVVIYGGEVDVEVEPQPYKLEVLAAANTDNNF